MRKCNSYFKKRRETRRHAPQKDKPAPAKSRNPPSHPSPTRRNRTLKARSIPYPIKSIREITQENQEEENISKNALKTKRIFGIIKM